MTRDPERSEPVTLVKVCGIRTLAEGRAALGAGAGLLGFVFWRPSKRYVEPAAAAMVIRALRAEYRAWSAVGVFVEPDPADVAEASGLCGLDYVQLSGHEDAARVRAMARPVIKAVHVRAGQEAAAAATVREGRLGAHLYLLDTHREGLYGGTGEPFDWASLREVGQRCLVAGGLRPDNVGQAIGLLRPRGVDVSGGVEHPGGGKDPRLLAAFVEAVRMQDARRATGTKRTERKGLRTEEEETMRVGG